MLSSRPHQSNIWKKVVVSNDSTLSLSLSHTHTHTHTQEQSYLHSISSKILGGTTHNTHTPPGTELSSQYLFKDSWRHTHNTHPHPGNRAIFTTTTQSITVHSISSKFLRDADASRGLLLVLSAILNLQNNRDFFVPPNALGKDPLKQICGQSIPIFMCQMSHRMVNSPTPFSVPSFWD